VSCGGCISRLGAELVELRDASRVGGGFGLVESCVSGVEEPWASVGVFCRFRAGTARFRTSMS